MFSRRTVCKGAAHHHVLLLLLLLRPFRIVIFIWKMVKCRSSVVRQQRCSTFIYASRYNPYPKCYFIFSASCFVPLAHTIHLICIIDVSVIYALECKTRPFALKRLRQKYNYVYILYTHIELDNSEYKIAERHHHSAVAVRWTFCSRSTEAKTVAKITMINFS